MHDSAWTASFSLDQPFLAFGESSAAHGRKLVELNSRESEGEIDEPCDVLSDVQRHLKKFEHFSIRTGHLDHDHRMCYLRDS
jgi:hypothetical protein